MSQDEDEDTLGGCARKMKMKIKMKAIVHLASSFSFLFTPSWFCWFRRSCNFRKWKIYIWVKSTDGKFVSKIFRNDWRSKAKKCSWDQLFVGRKWWIPSSFPNPCVYKINSWSTCKCPKKCSIKARLNHRCQHVDRHFTQPVWTADWHVLCDFFVDRHVKLINILAVSSKIVY